MIISHLMENQKNFRTSIWKYDVSRWILAKKEGMKSKISKIIVIISESWFWLIVILVDSIKGAP
jgi:hypothetical protein